MATSLTSPAGGAATHEAHRAHRWEKPFGVMSDGDIRTVLAMEPFCGMCPSEEDAKRTAFVSFGVPISVHGILKNDARLRTYRRGEFVVRKEDYGTATFFLMKGGLLRVIEPDLPAKMLGRRADQHMGFFKSALSYVGDQIRKRPAEYRSGRYTAAPKDEAGTGVTEAQFKNILDERKFTAHRMEPGVFIGEIGAIYRTPRSSTILAESQCTVLEIRWQGLRDLMEIDQAIAKHIDGLYRERSLKSALERMPYFDALPERALGAIEFATYGKYDEWSYDYISLPEEEKFAVVANEELIAEEGTYPNGVIIIRGGFARESRRRGYGHQTVNYLTSGQVFGLTEAFHNWRNPESMIALRHSLRAIGYTHVLRVPTRLVEEFVLPAMAAKGVEAPAATDQEALEQDFFEFLADNRTFNGRQTMLIDLDRCTRCDDCVRGCAAAHGGNPRFQRHGPVNGNLMVANACMHCADPVCMIGCPTGAIHRERLRGRVVINEQTCIGCATCYQNCPYDAIRMVPVRDRMGAFRIALEGDQAGKPIYKATKCDLCIDQSGGPACVRACPHDALVRMNMGHTEALGAFVKQ